MLVTGGAGFIGSNLVENLLAQGHEVSVFDNFSTGRRDYVENSKVTLIEADMVSDLSAVQRSVEGVDTVFHLAANADVKDGWLHPRKDLEQNVIATLNFAEAASKAEVKNFVFTSTGSTYGEAAIPTPENAPFPLQTSLYGASKISAESFLQAYAEAGKFKVTIFRLVSALGPRYTHGHVIDFLRQLKKDPTRLTVLGNGYQQKSYMHVTDCVEGIASVRGPEKCEVINLGRKEYAIVRDSIGWITEEMGIQPELIFGTEDRGWIGDNPQILLDVTKAENLGWVAKKSIKDSVVDTVRWLLAHDEVLGA